jgi:hypothetical protein
MLKINKNVVVLAAGVIASSRGTNRRFLVSLVSAGVGFCDLRRGVCTE